MTKFVSIATKNGNVEVEAELLKGYLSETAEHYEAIDEAKNELKLIGEAIEEKTGIKPAQFLKYAKARFDEKTEASKEIGELFTALDDAIDG